MYQRDKHNQPYCADRHDFLLRNMWMNVQKAISNTQMKWEKTINRRLTSWRQEQRARDRENETQPHHFINTQSAQCVAKQTESGWTEDIYGAGNTRCKTCAFRPNHFINHFAVVLHSEFQQNHVPILKPIKIENHFVIRRNRINVCAPFLLSIQRV